MKDGDAEQAGRGEVVREQQGTGGGGDRKEVREKVQRGRGWIPGEELEPEMP